MSNGFKAFPYCETRSMPNKLMLLEALFGKEFGKEFAKEFGTEFGNEFGKDK